MTVSLRPVEASDFELVKSWAEQKESGEFFRRFPPTMAWTRESFVTSFPESSSFIIREEDTPVGLAIIANYDANAKKAEYGLVITEHPKRREICFEASRQCFEFFFEYLGQNKLYSTTLVHRDKLLAFKAAWYFKTDGILRDNVCINGKFYDEVCDSLTRADYLKAKEKLNGRSLSEKRSRFATSRTGTKR